MVAMASEERSSQLSPQRGIGVAPVEPPTSATCGRLSHVVSDSIRVAYDALMSGDVDPLAALIEPGMEWRGRRRISRPWRPPA